MTLGFDWDEVNRAEIARHGVTVAVAEAVFIAPDMFLRPGKKGRTLAYGNVDGRFHCVVFVRSGEFRIRVTTAYRTNPKRIK